MGLGITRRGQVRWWWALLVPQHWPRFHSPFVVLGLYHDRGGHAFELLELDRNTRW
jgi:hypothetical protein